MITRKPIFLNIFSDRFKEIQNIKFINESILFQLLTVGWIQHDLNKPSSLITNEKEKKIEINTRCSERLAIAEFSTHLPVTQEHIKTLIEDEFQFDHADIEYEFESYIRYARDSTFLSVEENNSFRFLLKPLLEYFVASRIVREINEYDKHSKIINILLPNLSLEIFNFIKSIIEANWLIKPHFFTDQVDSENKIISKIDKSENLIKIINNNRNSDLRLGNVIRILDMLEKIPDKVNLSYLNLEQTEFQGTSFNGVYFHHTNLSHSFLNSDLSEADLSEADLSEADLINTNLNNTDFKESILFKTRFEKSNLVESKFHYSKLKKTRFHK